MNFLRKIYPKSFKRILFALILVISVTTITMGAVYDVALKSVTFALVDEFNGVNDDKVVSTRKATVEEFLEENNVELGENDLINKDLSAEIVDNDILIVKRGRVIELSADGKVEIVTVTRSTVGEVLEELKIVLDEDDIVNPDAQTRIENGLSITVDRIETQEVSETQKIEFNTKKVNDKTLAKGKTKVSVEGKNGEKTITYLVKKKNGEIVSKDVIKEEITKKAVDKVVKVGTKVVKKSKQSSTTNVKSDKNFSYSKKLTMTATAYDSSAQSNGGYTKTAYGLTPQFGVVAVDPKVIPLGTKLYVESSDGGKSWVYGHCIAGDTGGAIKGNKIDLCFNTRSECKKFGRRTATVYVLK